MKRWTRWLALGTLVSVTACGSGGTASAPTAAPAAPSSAPAATAQIPAMADAAPSAATAASGATTGGFDCGDRTKLGKELHVFSWADYWPTEDGNNYLKDFEAACGVKVTLDTYPSNEDLAAKLRSGNSGYDVVVPSDYMVDILAREESAGQARQGAGAEHRQP